MESQPKHPVLPSNYVTITDLKERWLRRQQEKQRETERRKIKDKHVEVQEEVPKVHAEAQDVDLKAPKRSYRTKNTKSNTKFTFRRPISRHRIHTNGTLEGHRCSAAKVDNKPTKVNEKVELIDPKAEGVDIGAVVAIGEERIESRDQEESDALAIEAAAVVEGGKSESQHKKTDGFKMKKRRMRKMKESDEIQNPWAKEDLNRETAKSAPNKEMPAIFSMVREVRYRQVEAGKVVDSGHGKITDRTADIGRRLRGVSLRGERDRRRSGEWPTNGTLEGHRCSAAKVDNKPTKVNEKVELIDPKPEGVDIGAVVAIGEERIESRDQEESDALAIEAAAVVEGGISESQHKKTDGLKMKKRRTRKMKKRRMRKMKESDEIQNPWAKEDLNRETAKSAPNKEMPAIFSMVREVRYRQVEAGKVVDSGHGKITDRTADIGRRLRGVSFRGERDRRRSGEWPTGMREGRQRNRSYGGLQWREVKKEEYGQAAVA